MTDEFEACWERFSDQLSFALADIAASDHLSEETLDKLQYAAVTVFREQLDLIWIDRLKTADARVKLTVQ
jgi:hypothetical protein